MWLVQNDANSRRISLEELLGHACAATLVVDVQSGQEELEGDYEEDEETHARGGGGDYCCEKTG